MVVNSLLGSKKSACFNDLTGCSSSPVLGLYLCDTTCVFDRNCVFNGLSSHRLIILQVLTFQIWFPFFDIFSREADRCLDGPLKLSLYANCVVCCFICSADRF